MKISRLVFISLIFIFISTLSSLVLASVEEILLDDPKLLQESLDQSYDLAAAGLRLPEIESSILNTKSHNKLIDLVLLYGSGDDIKESNNLLARPIDNEVNEKRLTLEDDQKNEGISLNPLPGVSVDADYNKDDSEDNTTEENTNVSLKYWLNNKTLLRAEYGMENKEWWDIEDIELENNRDEEIEVGESSQELTFNEEKNQTSRLGLSFLTNDRVTISADYVDSTSIDTDYSTIFGVEYKDDNGVIKYHYQVDFGDQSAKESGLVFGYKDLATFNATYKIFDPKVIEDQLNESVWDIGIDVNLSDISTISFGYQLEKKLPELLIDEEDDEESNIKAELKLKF